MTAMLIPQQSHAIGRHIIRCDGAVALLSALNTAAL